MEQGGYRIVLEIDGSKVPMKRFVRDIVSRGILGMIGTLRGGEDPSRIVITLERLTEEGEGA